MWTVRSRRCLVTGANSGIGKETALGLCERGAKVVLACRTLGKADRARDEIRKRVPRAELDVLVCDLSEVRSVREAAATVGERFGELSVIVHNAGAVMPARRLNSTGHEMTLATNHLGPFLLTALLLERLKANQPARVVVVASQVESRGSIDFDDLHGSHQYEPLRAYFQSKLANVLFTYELARRLRGTDVTANCLHPGVIATGLLSDYMGKPRKLGLLNRLTHPGPKVGAKTSIRLAVDAALEGVTGKYFRPEGEASSSKRSYDPELASRLWQVSEALVGVGAV